MRHSRVFVFLLVACGAPSAQPTTATTGAATGTGSSTGTAETATGSESVSGAGDTQAVGECVPTEASIRETIIEPMCAIGACHDAAAAAGGLELSVANLEAALAGTPSGTCDGEVLLVPGSPESSFLFDKLGGQPQCGGPMPPNAALDDVQRQCVADWITQAQGDCETCGGQTCVDLQSSAEHCGGCDQPCPDGVACIEAECACAPGTTVCDARCVDTLSDPAHCGGCGEGCEDGLFCLAGLCTDDCGGLSECTGACVNLDTNPLHCGDCDQPCGDGKTCQSGGCGCDAPATSYAADIEPILVSTCATMGCHRPMGPMSGAEGLNLAAGAGYDALVNVPSTQCANRSLVAPGSPGSSYLNDKILGINLCSGTAMPKSGSTLTAADLQADSDWICSGAAP